MIYIISRGQKDIFKILTFSYFQRIVFSTNSQDLYYNLFCIKCYNLYQLSTNYFLLRKLLSQKNHFYAYLLSKQNFIVLVI